MNRRARNFVTSASPEELLRWYALFHGPAFRPPGAPPVPKPVISTSEEIDIADRQRRALDEFNKQRNPWPQV